ncbi:MAG: carbohydrate porin [Rickettsiales bacterium]
MAKNTTKSSILKGMLSRTSRCSPLVMAMLGLSLFAQPTGATEMEPAKPTSIDPQPREENAYANSVFGDWGGLRTRLSEWGIEPAIQYKGDFWAVTNGGLKSGTNYNDNLDIRFEIDGEKLWGVRGSKAFVYFLNNAGSHPNGSRIGSVQGIDNIEVTQGTNTFKLYEAWLEQEFFDGGLSVLVGLHDLNTEYLVTDASLNFNLPVMQTQQSFAQTGPAGPSIFPNTALAVRVQVNPSDDTYVSFGAFNALAGDPDRVRGTQIDTEFERGALLISEIGYTPKTANSELVLNKLAIGGWGYTSKVDDISAVDVNGNPVRRAQAGAYLLSSARFYYDEPTGHSLTAIARAGLADGDTAQVDWDYELGLTANGWVPTRPDSEFGAGFAEAHNGNKYRDSVGGPSDDSEYGIEVYYRDTVYPGVILQPDFQYVINPGSDPTVENATVFGLRADVSL